MKSSGLALALLLSTSSGFADAQAQIPAQPLPNDPYKATLPTRPGDRDYTIHLRVIDHGSKYKRETLDRFVHATELIYSQCPGVRAHVKIDENIEADTFVLHMGYSSTLDGVMTLNPQWFEMHLPWTATRKHDVADVHLIDHFTDENRRAFDNGGKSDDAFQACRVAQADALEKECRSKNRILTSTFPGNSEMLRAAVQSCIDSQLDARLAKCVKISEFYQGQAFDADRVDSLYLDSRPEGARVPIASQVAGFSVTLAMKTHEAYEGDIVRIYDPSRPRSAEENQKIDVRAPIRIDPRDYIAAAITRNSSLLAHELGHIVLESQGKGEYHDHFCPAFGETCKKDYVMSGGGSSEFEVLGAPKFKKVVGYSPLPLVDPVQCQNLIRHPLVRAE